MFEKIRLAFSALKMGQSLLQSATWKNRQLATNAIAAVLVFIFAFIPKAGLTNEDIQNLAMAAALIGGVVNAYFTVATSDKVGFRDVNGNGINDDDELQDSVDLPKTEVPAESSVNSGAHGLSGN